MAAEITGKPSGWRGPAAEYTPNHGSVGPKRVVFVGASYKFPHRVVRDMLLVGGFDDVEVVLHDIDAVPLKIAGDLVERMVRQKNTKIKVRRTLDRREALKDADAVILSITTGGQESDFRAFEVCARYGLPVGIGDTMGPAALARNLRTVPVAVALAREMESLCPHAIMCNFTNPMSALTGAMARHSAIPVYGLCHSADELFEYFARVFQVHKRDLALELGGVNHQSFVIRLFVKGVDRTRDILAASRSSSARIADTLLETEHDVQLQQDVCKVLGAWPSCGGSHLAEFYPFFYTPRRTDELGLRAHLKKIMPGRAPFGRTPCPPLISDWAYGPEGVGDMHLLTAEHAHELLWATFTGEPFRRALNILNTGGYVKRLPRTACVEVMATLAGSKLSVDPLELPGAVYSLVERWCTIHDLSIRAAMECERDCARQALFLDPHVTDLYDIDGLLADFLAALEPWLPRGWFKR